MADGSTLENSPGADRLAPALAELLKLAAPTVAQMASYTLMQFIDTWMLAHLGTGAPTAAANSGMMSFSVLGFGMGVLWIVNTLVSQAFGRRDESECGRYMWQGIWFACAYAILLAPAILLARPMFAAFGHPAIEVRFETDYYQIALSGAIFKLLGTALGQFLLAVDRPAPVLFSAAWGVAINIIAAWTLVFGHFGLPSLGVSGSAWAMNVGTACETAALAFFVFRPDVVERFNVLDWQLRWPAMRALLRFGLPSGLQWVMDILAWSLFANAIIGIVGPEAMAANTFMMRYMIVSFMPAIGISTAVTALVGRYIGAGRPDIAVRRAHLAFALTAGYQVSCGVVFLLARRQLLKVFTSDAAVLRIGELYLIYSAVYQLFDSLYINYNGALRGAGDTLVPAVVTGVLNWGINVTGGFFVAKYFRSLGPGGPWLVATCYGAILGAFIFVRFQRGKWRQIHLTDEPASNVRIASATMG